MKILSIILVSLVISSQVVNAQTETLFATVDVSSYKLPDAKTSVKKTALNTNYIKKMEHPNLSQYVLDMRDYIGRYDCRTHKNFNATTKQVEVIFKSEKSHILVEYDSNGQIVRTEEVFKNVKIPQKVREAVFYVYSGWILTKVKYFSKYNVGSPITHYYKVEIQKGGEKKVIKVLSNGEFL